VHDRTAASEDFAPAARIAGNAGLCSIRRFGTRDAAIPAAGGFNPEFS
jgi:hypothetical protein